MNNLRPFIENIKSKMKDHYKDHEDPPDCIVCGSYGDHSGAYVTTLGITKDFKDFLIPHMPVAEFLQKAKKFKGTIDSFSLRCVCATPYDNKAAEASQQANTRRYYQRLFPKNQIVFKPTRYSYNVAMLHLINKLGRNNGG